MPWSAGSFTRNQDFTADRDAGEPDHFIQAELVDDEFDNVKAGLEALLLRDGTNRPSTHLDWDGFRIENLGAPTLANDAATKAYVDATVAGSNFVASTIVVGTLTVNTSATIKSLMAGNTGSHTSGYRNKIINGDFPIWQRGTNITVVSEDYGPDRWVHTRDGSGATVSVSRQTHTPGQTDVPGNPKYYARIAQSVAGSGGTYHRFAQRVEGVETLSGGSATVTFSARVGSGTISVIPSLVQDFGNGGSPDVETATAAVTLTTSWQTFAKKFTVPSISGKTVSGGDDFLELRLSLPANAVQTIDIAHVSVVGGDATAETDPFSPRHISDEWSLCHRYYGQTYGEGTSPGTATSAGESRCRLTNLGSNSAHTITDNFQFPESLRVSPTVTVFSPFSGASGKMYSYQLSIDVTASVFNSNETKTTVQGAQPSGTHHVDVVYHLIWEAEL